MTVCSLLWDELAANLNAGEEDVFRKAIGNDLIEENEGLFHEANVLREILDSVEDDIEQKLDSQRILETPARQLLEEELRILSQHVEESWKLENAQPSASNNASVLLKRIHETDGRSKQISDPFLKDQRCKNTLGYVMSKKAMQERKNGRDDFKTRSMSQQNEVKSKPKASQDGANRRTFGYMHGLDFHDLKNKVNTSDFDAVVDSVRLAIASEHCALLEDVRWLKDCLEDSTLLYSSVNANPPSVVEMKDCAKKLQESINSTKHSQNLHTLQLESLHSDKLSKQSSSLPQESRRAYSKATKLPKINIGN